MILRLTIFIILLSSTWIYGQIDIIPDAELAYQTTFLEGKKYQLIGRQDKAEDIFKKLYEKDKTNAVVTFELAQLYYTSQKIDQALKFSSLAANREPDNTHYQKFFGIVSLESDKYTDAISAFKNLNEKDPKNEEYADKLSTAYMLSGDYDRSIEVYTNLQSLIGIKEEIVKRKIDLYQLSNNNNAIEKELKNLVTLFPNDKSYLHNLAAFYNDQQKNDDARAIYERILIIDENDATANLALIKNTDKTFNDNNYLRSLLPIIEDENIDVDRKVIELLPYVEELADNNDSELGNALESVTEKLKNVHSDEAKAYAIYGDVLLLNRKDNEAIKMYQKTIELDNSIYSVWEQMMYAMATEKSYGVLEETSSEAIDYFPNEPSAYLMFGIALKENRKTKKAISYLEDGVLVASGDDLMKSRILTILAEAHIENKDYEKAVISLNEAIDISNGKNKQATDLKSSIQEELFMRGIK